MYAVAQVPAAEVLRGFLVPAVPRANIGQVGRGWGPAQTEGRGLALWLGRPLGAGFGRFWLAGWGGAGAWGVGHPRPFANKRLCGAGGMQSEVGYASKSRSHESMERGETKKAPKTRFNQAVALLGSLLMPHNLFLHSALVQVGGPRARRGAGAFGLPAGFFVPPGRGVWLLAPGFDRAARSRDQQGAIRPRPAHRSARRAPKQPPSPSDRGAPNETTPPKPPRNPVSLRPPSTDARPARPRRRAPPGGAGLLRTGVRPRAPRVRPY